MLRRLAAALRRFLCWLAGHPPEVLQQGKPYCAFCRRQEKARARQAADQVLGGGARR